MSPEQLLGEPVDARSDLCSLGSTLRQLLSDRRAFSGDNVVTTLCAVVHKPHVPLQAVVEYVGPLGDVIEQLLLERPVDRPASALEVVLALEAASPEAAAAFLARVW
ncbi:MAG: hypothetical protein FJ137_15375 [Deltaproteobacteria bacterium]|nr:hypothetical protein [Deltaproteobacteria bacterium]